jgi:hypothetical protein
MASGASVVEACREAAVPHDWRTSVIPRIEEIYCGGAAELTS